MLNLLTSSTVNGLCKGGDFSTATLSHFPVAATRVMLKSFRASIQYNYEIELSDKIVKID